MRNFFKKKNAAQATTSSSQKDFYLRILFQKTRLKDVMRTKVAKVYEDEDFSQVGQTFINEKVFHLPVLSRQNKVVGVISQKYLYRTHSPRKKYGQEIDYNPNVIVDGDSYYFKDTLDSYFLRKIMKKDPLTLNQDDSLGRAVTAMAQKNISCIPVVDDQRNFKGLVTHQDIIDLLGQVLEELE